MQRINIGEGINLGYIQKTKFKTNFFKVCFCMNLEKGVPTNLSLLAGVLMRASKNYPSISAINNRLD